MFDGLRSFLEEITTGDRPAADFAPDDHRLAAVALLIHIAAADGEVDPAEQKRLHRLVEQRYGLDRAVADRLIRHATADEREAVDLYHFTRVLTRRLDPAGRQAVVEALWDMAYADGEVHELEENIVWRVAELLGVSARDRVELRRRAEREGPEDASDQGPWGVALNKPAGA
jgi:uncharacterized tellurite resistance protein B-like protein